MKKTIALLLAVMLVVSMAPAAFAANTTTLTTNVPAAEYVLNIPADQQITYGATSTRIGNVTITGAKNFASGKNIDVTITYSAFTSEAVTTTIPYTLNACGTGQNIGRSKAIKSGTALTFKGKSDGTVEEKVTDYITYTESPTMHEASCSMDALSVSILSSDWGKALYGDYSSVITFTAEVVVD